MRSFHRPLVATAAAVLFGTAALTLAATPTTKPTAPTLKPGQETAETASQHIQSLRQIRRTMNEALKMLENEPMADGDIQRPEAIRSLQVAVDHVNTEVKDFEAAQRKAGKLK